MRTPLDFSVDSVYVVDWADAGPLYYGEVTETVSARSVVRITRRS